MKESISVDSKDFNGLYKRAKKLYPDLAIWERIPMNRIRERLLSGDNDVGSIEDACREALSEYIGDILRSMDRDRPIDLPHYTEEDRDELTRYFWEAKRVPGMRNVRDYFQSKRLAREEELEVLMSEV